ncbi:hypothetical protein [Nonomuraea sp. NPDC001699]
MGKMLIALAMTATVMSTAPATPTTAAPASAATEAAAAAQVVAPLKRLTGDALTGLSLTVGAEPYTQPMEDAFALTTLDQVLSGDDRTQLPTPADDPACASRMQSFGPTTGGVGRAFCWDAKLQGLTGETAWVPQGLATSGEARNDAAPVPTSKDALITSWSWQNPPTHSLANSVRLSVVNLNDMRYRTVLPVWVRPDGTLSRIYGHGGGLAWSGPYLFMATTPGWPDGTGAPSAKRSAIRVFDTRRIYRHQTKLDDYQYVMPEVANFVSPDLDFDYISLDRTSTGRQALVVGDYRATWLNGQPQPLNGTRIARYAFRSAETGDYRLGLTPTAAWESTTPTTAETHAISDVQGVQLHDGRLYVNMSAGKFVNVPYSRRFASVDLASMTMTARTNWGYRPEDLSLWYSGTGGELWGLTEGEDQRVVYSVALDNLSP